MKKIISLVAIILVVGSAILFAWLRSRPAAETVTTDTGSSVSVINDAPETTESTGVSAGSSTAAIPSGDTITIGTSQGGVTMNNFYKIGTDFDSSEIIVTSTPQFEIDYVEDGNVFQVVVLQEPIADADKAGEAALLSILGIGKEDVCKLNASVVVPYNIDQTLGGKTYGLSLCSGGAFE
jgi:hypothetical protein